MEVKASVWRSAVAELLCVENSVDYNVIEPSRRSGSERLVQEIPDHDGSGRQQVPVRGP